MHRRAICLDSSRAGIRNEPGANAKCFNPIEFTNAARQSKFLRGSDPIME